MKQTFNKADVLRIIKDREIELTRQFHTKEHNLGNCNTRNEVKSLEAQWRKELAAAIRPGIIIDGVRLKNHRKMIARIAKSIVNGGSRYGGCAEQWDASRCKSIVSTEKAFDARKEALNTVYRKAQSALSSLREEISLAGVPADIVKRLNAISTMLA